MDKKRLRFYYLFAFLGLLFVEMSIALYVKDNFIRPYVGDIIVVLLIYCFIRIFVPVKVKLLPLYVTIFAVAVEVLQYFNIVELLGLGQYKFARVLIGTTFDIADVICYLVGGAIISLWQYYYDKKINEKNASL